MGLYYNTGQIAWRGPFGRVYALEAQGIMITGWLNKGGSVATAGGLLFITGKLLW